MADVAIRIENLGKRFQLRHAAARPYRTLREDLLHLPRRLWRTVARRESTEEFWALREVSLEIRRGEILGLIGRNGAGKSTLLKILSRIVAPTTGTADLFGRVGSLLEVGTGFHPELTGRENIFLSGAILGMRREEVRTCFDEIVAFAEVEKFLDTPCKHYSSGMYARLGFAVAAHLRAEILLVDEVLAVGDATFQHKCLGKMDEVAHGGRTVVFVSHNLRALQRLCSRAVVLEAGRAIFHGDTHDAIDRYLGRDMHSAVANRYRDGANRNAKPADRITEVTVRNWDRDTAVLSTGPLEISVACTTEQTSTEVVLLVGVYDLSGNRVLFLDSSTLPELKLRTENHTLRVCARLSRDFSLRPGDYALNVALCQSGRVVHHLPDACRLEVHEGNFFGSGKVPESPVFVAQTWSVFQTTS